ncbi:MAG: hypothetical protein Q4D89_12910 [Arachnia propionica]|uniref:hypothetical protein n=1 Tax=Arachnia propionica TaxID=1750 RepID=UPI0026FAC18A|nr:hypothetical protein [Arachnia propionica]
MTTTITHARIFDGEHLTAASTVRFEDFFVVAVSDESTIRQDDLVGDEHVGPEAGNTGSHYLPRPTARVPDRMPAMTPGSSKGWR